MICFGIVETRWWNCRVTEWRNGRWRLRDAGQGGGFGLARRWPRASERCNLSPQRLRLDCRAAASMAPIDGHLLSGIATHRQEARCLRLCLGSLLPWHRVRKASISPLSSWQKFISVVLAGFILICIPAVDEVSATFSQRFGKRIDRKLISIVPLFECCRRCGIFTWCHGILGWFFMGF